MSGEYKMKQIDFDKDRYFYADFGVPVPIGFAVLSEANRQDDKLFYSCDKIYDSQGFQIVPLDEHFKSIEEIKAKSGQTYYISDDEYFRHSYVQKKKHDFQ
jgi:hypothetical protein